MIAAVAQALGMQSGIDVTVGYKQDGGISSVKVVAAVNS
jgi:hypothetical protein